MDKPETSSNNNREAPKSLVKSFEEKIKNHVNPNTIDTSCRIVRVPDSLRDQLSGGDKTFYIPEVVSFGPYHSHHDHLSGMDAHKVRAVNSVLTRSKRPLKDILDSIYNLGDEARYCYEQPFDLEKDKLVEMLFLDGCFLLEIIRGHKHEKGFEGYPLNDPVFCRRGYNNMASSIIRDMIKVENQIPFIILEKLSALSDGEAKDVTKSTAFMFIKWLTGVKLEDSQLDVWAKDFARSNFLHCLHVFQSSLLIGIGTDSDNASLINPPNRSVDSMINVAAQHDRFFHSATDLIEYGIKLKRRMNEMQPFWDINFKKGTLEMPTLFINGRVKAAFPNLIIFEQLGKRCNNVRPIVTEYVAFMDKLMSSARDVGRLNNAGIIVHQLRNDAVVAKLFNDLRNAAFLEANPNSHYSGLYTKINGHCNRRNRWKSEFKRTYFSNPWALASLLAAIVLLVLGFLQTYYTVYAYYWPSS